MKLLLGHHSPETAYVVPDYPYGYRLRCRIRYWLEHVPRKGVRFWSQTTNPKRGHVWNKPKASTFCRLGGAMYVDGEGHVRWSGLTEYATLSASLAWAETYGPGVPEGAQEDLRNWLRAKAAYEERKAAGQVQVTTVISGPGGVVLSETTRILKSEDQLQHENETATATADGG